MERNEQNLLLEEINQRTYELLLVPCAGKRKATKIKISLTAGELDITLMLT